MFEDVTSALSLPALYGAPQATMAGSRVAIGASRREAVTERNSRWPWPPLAFVVGCMKSFYCLSN